ncbi:phage tail protein [Timonella senegalensis]|uniref:phage tail protein n=1 Tax=Timonella senegalensis TaxID=1465825 RepID=UPI00031BE79A|nr:tape measure domain-containing protein [Timonella senegalensis]
MATELAAAYVTLVPSLKGAQKQISTQLSGIDMGAAGKSMGKNLSSSIGRGMRLKEVGSKIQSLGSGLSSVGSKISSYITKPAVGAAMAVAGVSAALGFKRLVGIDTARAKLKALGHDGKSIETIMDSALKSVKGTAFGLGDAANIAASAVAAGVKPGKDLTKYLTMTADAAAIAGIGLGEMGYILNQVQTGQVAYTDSLNMLADRGIPIYQWLAKEAGVTAGEVKELASKGKISSEEFFDAIKKNIGGAAKVVGENSFTGAWDNLKASLGRVGASFLDAGGKGGGFFSQLKPLMGDLTKQMDSLGPKAEELGVKFGKAFASMVEKVKELSDKWNDLDDDTKSTILKVAGAVVVLGPVLSMIGSVVSTIGSFVGGIGALTAGLSGGGGVAALGAKFLKVGGIVGVVVGLVATLWNTSDEFRLSLENAGTKMSEIFTKLKEDLGPVIDGIREDLGPAMESLGSSLARIINSAIPLVQQLASMFSNLMTVLGPIIEAVLRGLGPAFETFGATVERIFGLITRQLAGISANWSDAIAGVQALVAGDWSTAWESARSIVSRNFQGIKDAAATGIRSVSGLVTGQMKSLAAAFGLDWDRMVTSAQTAWSRMEAAASQGAIRVAAAVIGLRARIQGAFANAGSILYGAGKAIIDGLWQGLQSGFGKVQEGLNWLTSKIPDWKGPKKKDKSLLTAAGKSIILGFVKGLESGYDGVKKSLKKFTDALGKIPTSKLTKGQNAQLKATKAWAKSMSKTTKTLWDDGKYKGGVKRWLGLNNGTVKLLKSLTAAGNWRTKKNNKYQLVASKTVKSASLADIGKAQDGVQRLLDRAKKSLADMKKARADMKAQIANSIKGELDITSGMTTGSGHYLTGQAGFKAVAGSVKSMAARAKKFAGKLKELVAKGIPPGLVQEVAGLGTEKGMQVANALLSGTSAQVKELKADYSSLNTWSKNAGDYVAGQMFDAGIQAQAGLVKGLEADADKLAKAAKKLADRLVKAVKKALGIKSPSRVFRDQIGAMVDAGLAQGIGAGLSLRAAESVALGIQKPFSNVNPDVSFGSRLPGSVAGSGDGRRLSDADVAALAAMLEGRPVEVTSSVDFTLEGRPLASFMAAGRRAEDRWR